MILPIFWGTRPGKHTKKRSKMVIEIVDLAMKNGGSFHSYVAVYQRVIQSHIIKQHGVRTLLMLVSFFETFVFSTAG